MAAAPIFGSNGELLYFYGLGTDVDTAEVAAREMAVLPESLPQMVWKVDTKGYVMYANKRFLNYFGKSANDTINVFDKEIVHPDDYAATMNAFDEASKNKVQFTVVRKLKQANGQYNQFVTKGIPVLDDSGNPTSWYGTCTLQDK